MDIRNLPYSVAEVMVRYLTMSKPLIKTVEKQGVELHLVEDMDSPKFFFTIEKVELKESTATVVISHKPRHKDNPFSQRYRIKPEELDKRFSAWYETIVPYFTLLNKLVGIDEKDFDQVVSDLQIDLGQDGHEYFSIPEVLAIDSYLNSAEQLIDKEQIDEAQEPYVTDFVGDLKDLKKNQTRLTKYEVRKRIVGLLVRSKKIGVEYFKKFLKLTIDEFAKKFISGSVDEVFQRFLG